MCDIFGNTLLLVWTARWKLMTLALKGAKPASEDAAPNAAQAVVHLNQRQVVKFADRIALVAVILSGAFSALKGIATHHRHDAQVAPAERVDQRLPAVNLIIASPKRYILRTYHGISHSHLREYIDDFVFQFDRRYWGSLLPRRLIQAIVNYAFI